MATQLTNVRTSDARFHGRLALAIGILVPLAAAVGLAAVVGPTIHLKTFPWLMARALGIAAYLSLTSLVAIGLWMRHPWRFKMRFGHAESMLRAHATLAVATVTLVVTHILFLATDHYAGVGWSGALVPGLSHYRRFGVSLGVLGFDLMVAITLTARFAGRRFTRRWLPIHRLALLTFAATWLHGVFSGIDVVLLRPIYVVTGAVVVALAATRRMASKNDQLDERGVRLPGSELGRGGPGALRRAPVRAR